jgi:UDP:flavonoid glycosyltransferase YjiC (YdhE family)
LATPSKILIAPLDWGLGHTTRCIPIIRYLIARGSEVYAAAEGASARLLLENFPVINIIPLDGYRIRYSKKREMFTAKILLQIPKILATVKKEHQWLQQQQQIHQFDLIISDNRYGLYHDKVPCVILTHQLQILSGKGNLADNILRRLHYQLLDRFSKCWIVDEESNGGFSGKLAHPKTLPVHAAYIGLLSQFAGCLPDSNNQDNNKQVLVLLSGPEPMRSQLELLVLQQAKTLTAYQFTIVGGNPLGNMIYNLPQHITYHTHLNAQRLLPELQNASLVICRSGYSTIMDLAVLGKKALLIPTPGQTEQEYLAKYLEDKKYFRTCTQEALQLATHIPMTLSSETQPATVLDNRIKTLLETIW